MTILKALIASLLILFLSIANAGEFAVSPLVLDVEGIKNRPVPFEFTVKAKKPGEVALKVFDLKQMETGHMGFIEGEKKNKESKYNWVKLETTGFKLKEDEYSVVKGTVTIPSKAKGKHLAAIMVEEVKPENDKKGIEVNVRYAVVVKINTQKKGKKARVKTTFNELTFVKKEGMWIFEGWFENKGRAEGQLIAELQLRDDSRRLVGRIPMKTLSAWQRREEGSMVYPGSKVKIFGTLDSNITEGAYTVRVKNKFNGRTQSVFKEQIDLKAIVPSKDGVKVNEMLDAGATTSDSLKPEVSAIHPIFTDNLLDTEFIRTESYRTES